jgi:hypothetical protein
METGPGASEPIRQLIRCINRAEIVKNFTNFLAALSGAANDPARQRAVPQLAGGVEPGFGCDKNVDAGKLFATITRSREPKVALGPNAVTAA